MAGPIVQSQPIVSLPKYNEKDTLRMFNAIAGDEAPPPYTETPEETLQKLHLKETEEEIGTTIYLLNREEEFAPGVKSFVPYGTFEFGRVKSIGAYKNQAWFKPFRSGGHAGVEDDISRDVTNVSDTKVDFEKIHIRKQMDLLVRPYSLDLFLENHMTTNAKLTGSMIFYDSEKKTETHFNLNGFQMAIVAKKVKTQVFSYPDTPKDIRGTQVGIRQISPYVYLSDVGSADPKTALQHRADAAQAIAEKKIQKIMFHALDEKSRKTLLPSVESLPREEQAILDKNTEVLKRMAIHFLADQFIHMTEIDVKVRNKITPRYQAFRKMLIAKEKPKDGKDPVEEYGLHRGNTADEALMETLRNQYADATMRCYELGYIEQCPEWKDYMEHPLYWFKYLEAYLTCTEFLEPFKSRVQNGDINVGTIPADKEILFWGNKLTLLNHTASDKDAAGMKVEVVLGALQSASTEGASLATLLTKEFATSAKELYRRLLEAKETEDNKKRFEKMSKDAHEIHQGILLEGAETIDHLVDPGSKLADGVLKYWKDRLPAGLVVPPRNAQQAILAVDAAAVMGDAAMPESTFDKVCQFFRNQSAGVSWRGLLCGAIKAIIKGTSLCVLFMAAASVFPDKNAPIGRVGLLITMLCAEGLRFLKWGLTKFVNWASARLLSLNGIAKHAINWVGRALIATQGSVLWAANMFVRHFDKIIKVVGLVAVGFSIYNSYKELTETKHLDPGYQTASYVFNAIQLSLGSLEGFFLLVDFLATIFTWTGRLATLAGPFAIGLGVISAVVVLVYYIYFTPDPLADVKKFLRVEGRAVGSYSAEKDEDE